MRSLTMKFGIATVSVMALAAATALPADSRSTDISVTGAAVLTSPLANKSQSITAQEPITIVESSEKKKKKKKKKKPRGSYSG